MNIRSTILACAVASFPGAHMAPCFAGAAAVDPKALALISAVAAATQKAHSLSADLTSINRYPHPDREFREVGMLRYMKPNYSYSALWIAVKDKTTGRWGKRGDAMIGASDGKNTWRISRDGEYDKNNTDAHGKRLGTGFEPTFDFFDSSQSIKAQIAEQRKKQQLITLADVGTQTWEGAVYQVVEWEYKVDYDFGADTTKHAPGGVVTEKDRLYIGSDLLIHRVTYEYNLGWTGERALRNVRVNAPMTAASFHYKLPANAHLPVPPPPLIANGALAPDFTATTPDGASIKLSDLKGKVVVLDFWSTWCGPCQASMPHLQHVYEQVKDKDVAILAVCVWDEKAAYDKWVTAKKDLYGFPTAFDPAGNKGKDIAKEKYSVSGIPTQFVIDRDGKIAASNVGYDGDGDHRLEASLAKLGVKVTEPEKKP
ncbi:hypothetical protein CCAX7_001750 [Capsulimonas corticalis]|uniref:Uncharacterized protein n=1 Tax=Capsulimonas corticalis TaxID=2219043 RepID=A0A402CRT5_9BACT|nr:TlpA disulfide reductase family protein [Capsulimonas corticalis]BDI28124.1 hypothetical protein CCAX7_001750 [Capsulimonas corticalis]